MIEVWKEIPDYEKYYEASNLGNIRKKDTKELLKQTNLSDYKTIRLKNKVLAINIPVHKIIAITFLENRNKLPIVHHKDLNKHNNNINNLKWVSYSENSLTNNRLGRTGNIHHKYNLIDKKTKNILLTGEVSEIKNCLNISKQRVYQIIKNGSIKYIIEEIK